MSLSKESRDYTAIRTVVGLLRYVRLPQGLKNSPAVFQRVVNALFASRKGRDVWEFMEDISMRTLTAEEHLRSLQSVLDTFLAAGARLKISKCTFGAREVEVLGHRISKQGLKPSDLHLQRIRDLRQPEMAST